MTVALGRALALVFALVVAAPTAAADPASAAPAVVTPWAVGVSTERQEHALRSFERGNLEFFESRYAQALAGYREAIRAWDHPAIRFNMAVCLINLDQPIEARENLERSLAFGEAPLGEDMFQQALTYRKLLDARLARVTLVCDEPGAKVTVDGRHLLTGPGAIELFRLPGDHQVVATKPGYLTTSETRTLIAGRALRIDIRLYPVPPATTTVRRWAPWKPWTVSAAGLVALGTGVFAYRAAGRTFDEYDAIVRRECPGGCPGAQAAQIPALATTHARAEERQAIAFSLFALGGSAVVAGVVGAVLNQPRRELVPAPARSQVVPVRGGGIVSVAWGF